MTTFRNKGAYNLGLFGPRMMNRLINNPGRIIDQTAASISQSNIAGTASYKWDQGWPSGLQSTQQLPVDFGKFENHTFFNSAEVKVNVSFDKVINEYPFDGEKVEVENFFDELGGFERYVFDLWPKYKNFLFFSGTRPWETPRGGKAAELGTHIKVSDHAGTLQPKLSKDKSGKGILDPGNGSISFEMQLFVPFGNIHDTQVILQKLSSSNQGITIGLDNVDPKTDPAVGMKHCNLWMIVSSGSDKVLSASMKIKKNAFTQLCCVLDKDSSHHQIKLYQSGNLVGSSSLGFLGELNFAGSDLIIGSGSAHATGTDGRLFNPVQTFSGALDELRVWHQARSEANQKQFQLVNVFASDSLKLYFKFNEITGSYDSNNISLDSSGNSLHSTITNFTTALRERFGIISGMVDERNQYNPVLFPSYNDVITLNSKLLNSASQYDASNPNLITRLIPPHYLIQDAYLQGFSNEKADIGELYVTGSQPFPGGGTLKSGQIVATLLFVWAKFFDEIKMYVDHFSELIHVDYSPFEGVTDQFLGFVAARKGFPLPNLFNNPDILQFLSGENILTDKKYAIKSLRVIQNEIWRRILVNLNDIVRSKGTVYSVKALFRAAGINPDTNLRLREFGGAAINEAFSKNSSRVHSTEVSFMFDMSGSLAPVDNPEAVNVQGFHSKRPHFISPFLSGSRYEVGYPGISGSMVKPPRLPDKYIHGVSNDRSDGLFTSGSWTYEAIYKFGVTSGSYGHFPTQSLVRMHTSGNLRGEMHSKASVGTPFLIFNLLAFSASNHYVDSGSLILYGRPEARPHAPLFRLALTATNIFDGDMWHISFGRYRQRAGYSMHSSSYFLRATKTHYGDVLINTITSSFFGTGSYSTASISHDVQECQTEEFNRYGAFLAIGSQSIGSVHNYFLNSIPSHKDASKLHLTQSKATEFSGKFTQLRFWSKPLTNTETVEHARNFKSLGVEDPTTNFNFVIAPSGAFEKLRMHVSVDQTVSASDASGNIALVDFSQQFTGTVPGGNDPLPPKPGVGGLEPNKVVINPTTFSYSFFDPKFDERSSNDKVRIRSFEDFKNIEMYGGAVAPIYEVPKSERPIDDTRFSIEASVVHALNEDIVSIFASFENFNEYLGRPELLFADNYPDLRTLRNVYFDRLTGKINMKAFFDVFRWLDDSYGILVERLLPSKTKFLGMNFVIESHMLERAKFRYKSIDSYLPLMLTADIVHIEGAQGNVDYETQAGYAFQSNLSGDAKLWADPGFFSVFLKPS